MTFEFGDDNKETRIAAGEDLQCPDLAPAYGVATDRLPQAAALRRIQGLKTDDPEQLKEWILRVVQALETTGRRGEQDDLRFQLKRLAQLPTEIVVYVVTQSLQVFDHEYKSLSKPIGHVKNGGSGTFIEFPLAPPRSQVCVRIPQVSCEFSIVRTGFER